MTWHDDLKLRATPMDRRLVDDAVYAYEDWLEECVRVQNSWTQWREAGTAEAGACFAAYLSAIDAEERAAEAFREAAMRLRRAAVRRPSSSPRSRSS